MNNKKYINGALFILTFAAMSACNVDNSQQKLVQQHTVVAEHSYLSHNSNQQDFRDVAFGNGVYLAVGTNGAIYTSTNKKHWYEQANITVKNINGIVFNEVRKKFYAVGDDGLFMTSSDGVSWTEYQTLSPNVRLNNINVLKNGNEVIGGDNGNIFEVVLSNDSADNDKVINRKFYNASSLDSSSSVNTIAEGPVYMVAGNSNGLSNIKDNSGFETTDWKYHDKLDGVEIADISFDSSSNYFHSVLRDGTVSSLGAKKQSNKWSIPVCVAHTGSGQCLIDTTANSIATDQSSENLLVVGGGLDNNHSFIANSEDSNSWIESRIPNTYKLNKIRCFGDASGSQCLAVGDHKSIIIVNVEDNKVKWTKVNITAPELTATYPENESSFANTTPDMKLSFNIPVKDVNDKTVTVYEDHIGGTKVKMNTFLPSQNQEIYTAAPVSKFKELTKYVVVVESGITDAEDMPIKAKIFTFTTGDFTAPEMVVINPEKGSEGITLTPNVQLKFSKAVTNANSSTISLHEGSDTGANVPISNLEPQLDNGYTFNITDKLKSLTLYCVVATNAIEDKYANKLVPTSSCFKTGDYIVPTVTMINPLENSTDASIDSAIELKFSKPVQNVDTKNVSIHKGSKTGPTVAIKNIANNGSDYVIEPTGRLPHNTALYVVLESAISDTTPNENKLQTAVFSFKTMEQTIKLVAPSTTTLTGQFLLNMTVDITENVRVDLPDGFTSDSKKSLTKRCIANTNCDLMVDVDADRRGTFTIHAQGEDTLATSQVDINISEWPAMVAFASRGDNTDKNVREQGKVEICTVGRKASPLPDCKVSTPINSISKEPVGEIYGTKILGGYIYLMTGRQSADGAKGNYSNKIGSDGIYKCNINKDTYLVDSCVKQVNGTLLSNANTRSMLLSLDSKYAYFDQMNNDQTIDRCDVSPTDGSLTNCAHATETKFDGKIERMVLSDSGKNIYVNLQDSGVKICKIDPDPKKILLTCSLAGDSTPQKEWGMSMGLDNSVMYFLGSGGMKSCKRDIDDYSLSNCSQNYDATITGLTGLAITKDYALVSKYDGGVIRICEWKDSTKRTFNNCNVKAGKATLTNLEGVDIFQ